MKKYELIEHTADIAVRVYGGDLEELFKNSAAALFSIITESIPSFPGTIKRKISLKAEVIEDLLVSWLNELISVFYTYKFFSLNYNIKINGTSLDCECEGIDFSPYSDKIQREVKAAVYHNLKIRKDNNTYLVEIIFDV